MNYDFSQLNDKEFEYLVIDLLSISFDRKIERFKPGKDQGVDGRFFSDDGYEVLIQCKHYLKSGYRALISKLKNEESKKVARLKPERYIFVTSLPLSRKNKNEILNIFFPNIKSESDIYGQEDLNDILSKSPETEGKHYKLWITSTNVFNRILNNAIKGRSEFEIEQIRNKSHKYVQTTNHESAIKILNKSNVLIISGEPGIGKTTLAENLCLYYASKGFEFIDIEENLSEAENVYNRSSKQVFYFDDFLGSNYLEAIENKKDSHIIKFIKRISSDKKKKFILTSRTNILNSGIYHSSIFSIGKLQNHEYLLTINNFGPLEKAKILYNHIWFSNLGEDYIEEIYKEKRYHDIINHKNFNPRIIEFITDIDRIHMDAKYYWEQILNILENPKDIWNDCFKTQSNEYVRCLVCLVVFNGNPIKEEDLKQSFYRLVELERITTSSHTDKSFKSIAQLAVKSFLNRNSFNGTITYSVFNPSIKDYILNEYCDEPTKLNNFFCSLFTIKSIEKLVSLGEAGIVDRNVVKSILENLFYNSLQMKKCCDYTIYLCYIFRNDSSKGESISKAITHIINGVNSFNEVIKLLKLILETQIKVEISSYVSLIDNIANDEYEIEHIILFNNFLSIYEIKNRELIDAIEDVIEDILIFEAENLKNDIDLDYHVRTFEIEDGDRDFDFNESGIRDDIYKLLTASLDGIDDQLKDRYKEELMDIVRDIDIDNLISGYLDSMRYEPGSYSNRTHSGNSSNAIDDLFERT